jgi:heme-binding protein
MRRGNIALKKVLIVASVAAVAAVGSSLIHPFGTTGISDDNQPLLRGAQIDPQTLAIVQRACQNCHSQRTEWPWYSRVAPMSWLIARDVQQARLHMNLSQWQDYSTDDRRRLLSEIGSAVRNHKMPVQRYVLLHPEARLTDSERQQIYRWTRTERSRLATAGPKMLRRNSWWAKTRRVDNGLNPPRTFDANVFSQLFDNLFTVTASVAASKEVSSQFETNPGW